VHDQHFTVADLLLSCVAVLIKELTALLVLLNLNQIYLFWN